MLTLAYLTLAVLGVGYIVVATALGHFGGDSGHDAAIGHAGGADGGYGIDQSGHGHSSADSQSGSDFHFPFFSPLALATLFASFGGYGLAALFGLRVNDGASVAIAGPAAVATAYGVTYLAHRIVATSRGSSQIRINQIVGASGEVTVPIPENGAGEATVMVGAERFAAPARDGHGKSIPRGSAVTVLSMAGTTMVVMRRNAPEDV